MKPEEIKAEVIQWAEKVGVSPKEIHLRKMKNKWASCSSKGRMTINPEVMEMSLHDRAEVILHELLHLRYPNHGKMFKRMLEYHLKDYKKARVGLYG